MFHIQVAQADARVDFVHPAQGALLDQPQLLPPDVQRVALVGNIPGLAVGGGGRQPQGFQAAIGLVGNFPHVLALEVRRSALRHAVRDADGHHDRQLHALGDGLGVSQAAQTHPAGAQAFGLGIQIQLLVHEAHVEQSLIAVVRKDGDEMGRFPLLPVVAVDGGDDAPHDLRAGDEGDEAVHIGTQIGQDGSVDSLGLVGADRAAAGDHIGNGHRQDSFREVAERNKPRLPLGGSCPVRD